MNIINSIKKAKIQWVVDSVCVDEKNKQCECKNQSEQRIRVRLVDHTKKLSKDGLFKVFESLFLPNVYSIESMLEKTMIKHFPKHPLTQEIFKMQGKTLIKFNSDIFDCEVLLLVKMALEEMMDSEQSNIQWNALKYIHQKDLDLIEYNLKQNIVVCIKTYEYITRSHLGAILKHVFCTNVHEILMFSNIERTELQNFALLTLEQAGRMTTEHDWIFNWTSFFCKEAESVDKVKADSMKYN